MTFDEFAHVSAALQEAYPRENILQSQSAIELWFRQLSDIPYEAMMLAVNKWIETNRWSPTIADLREQSAAIMLGEIPDWSEAWEKVLLAIRKFGPYRYHEAMDSLDDLTATTVRRLGFNSLCMSENLAADRANFRTIYTNLATRGRQLEQLPGSVRDAIKKVEQKRVKEIEQTKKKLVDYVRGK